jgi:hypothetical protein
MEPPTVPPISSKYKIRQCGRILFELSTENLSSSVSVSNRIRCLMEGEGQQIDRLDHAVRILNEIHIKVNHNSEH